MRFDGQQHSALRGGLLVCGSLMALSWTNGDAQVVKRPSAHSMVAMRVDSGPGPRRRGTFKEHEAGSAFQGELTQPLEKYTGQDLYDLEQKASWAGWERERKCPDKFDACKNNKPAARLQIEAIGDANELPITSPTSAFPNGVVIGVMRNVGNYRDLTSDIPGDEDIPSEYFFVVYPNGTQTASLKIARVTFVEQGGVKVPEPYVRIITPKTGITPCVDVPGHEGGPHHYKRKYPMADFATCSMPTPPDTLYPLVMKIGGKKEPGHGHKKSIRAADDATPWFSCNEGCCTTQSPP